VVDLLVLVDLLVVPCPYLAYLDLALFQVRLLVQVLPDDP
jgi:hypothetical protein